MRKILLLCLLRGTVAALGADNSPKPAGKILAVEGQPNPHSIAAGEPTPDLGGRPAELRPGPLPKPVRYEFASDQAVIAAAAALKAHLLQPTSVTGPLFGKVVLVEPGAWAACKDDKKLGRKNATPMHNFVRLGGSTLRLEGEILREPAEIARLEENLRELIRRDGGGSVRAMNAMEMSKWWTFIAFDIAEPVLVLETANARHYFIFTFPGTEGTVFGVDELTGLP